MESRRRKLNSFSRQCTAVGAYLLEIILEVEPYHGQRGGAGDCNSRFFWELLFIIAYMIYYIGALSNSKQSFAEHCQ